MERSPLRVEEMPEDAQPLPVPFVACWDEEALDSDRSYPLSFNFKQQPRHAATISAGPVSATAGSSTAALSNGGSSSSYAQLAPAAMPIDPPYKRSLEIMRSAKLQQQQPQQR